MRWNIDEYREFLELGDKIVIQRKNASPMERERFQVLEDFYEGLRNRDMLLEAYDDLATENERLRSILNRLTDYSTDVDTMINVEKFKFENERFRTVTKGLLNFAIDLCEDVGVSNHYPALEQAKRFLEVHP